MIDLNLVPTWITAWVNTWVNMTKHAKIAWMNVDTVFKKESG